MGKECQEMSNQKFGDYYVGLDIGTNSIGWAVTNPDYKVLRFNKKSMWGVRMFESASTAEERRLHRTNRRRLSRRKFRLDILKEIFENELNNIDPNFLTNLEDSALHIEDKRTENKYTLFNDNGYTDDDYHKNYPTIYHLRANLINNSEAHDLREVYLALHHIMKYRGHFLFEGDLKSDNNIEESFDLLNNSARNIYDTPIFKEDEQSYQSLKNILKNSSLTIRDQTNEIKKYMNTDIDKDVKKIFDKIVRLISGSKLPNLMELFPELEWDEKIGLGFKSSSIDEEIEALSMLDFEQLSLIEYAKSIYDWGLLEEIRDGEQFISNSKINSYKTHRKDLKELKVIVRKGATREVYNDFFHNEDNKSNYTAYVGNGKTKIANTDDFYKSVKKLLKSIKGFNFEKEKIISKIDTNQYMPKQRIGSNGVIPHQLHLIELRKILDNAQEYLPVLTKTDETGLTNKEKIIKTFKFRIPYYVGPLNPYHSDENEGNGTAWVVRKIKEGKVYPWNFEEMIDTSASAEKFITRMTNSCSYILNESVLPKHSLIYQKYMVLNEINNLKIDGQSFSVEIKQHLYDDLFVMQHKNVTKRTIKKWLMDNNYVSRNSDSIITGIDDQVKSKLTTYHDMKKIFGDTLPETKILDTIVYWMTLFSDSKNILVSKIEEQYPEILTSNQMKQLISKSYGGWGRLSRKFLEEVSDTTHFTEPTSIIQALYMTNNNLMELLTEQYEFSEKIEEFNQSNIKLEGKIDYSLVDNLPLSPSVKRSVWQTLKIMDELVSITGHAPNKIMVEMARGGGQKGRRTKSRKSHLIELYKNIKDEKDLLGKLENTNEAKLRSKKLYLYYTQRGKCMYSGDSISISQLFDKNIYDLDHIYPRSITKDDSLNNLVLVRKDLNQLKSDRELYEMPIKSEVVFLWKALKDQGFISTQKYERLIRKDPLTDAEKAGFIARQIVETQQSTKAISNIFKQLYPDTKIIFVKAGLISDFRQEQKNVNKDTGELNNGDYRHYIKLRTLNDYHHAKDAYLNIVVGNVYDTKFTSNPLNYIKKSTARQYNLGRMYDYEVTRNGYVAWLPGSEGSIKKINQTMKRNDILTTWRVADGKGGLFDQTLMVKGKGQVPIKDGLDIKKYGGYNKPTVAYYVVVEHARGKKRIRTLESIPLYAVEQVNTEERLEAYIKRELGLINPKVINNHIPARNALFEFDGIKGRITGKSGHQYLVRSEHQLLLPDNYYPAIKELEKYANPLNNYTIDKLKISRQFLEDLYKEFIVKAQMDVYKVKLSNFNETLKNGLDKISLMDDVDLAELLIEVSKLFKSSRETSNLKKISGSANAGTLKLGKNISNKEYITLVNQSITGLFENRVDLLK